MKPSPEQQAQNIRERIRAAQSKADRLAELAALALTPGWKVLEAELSGQIDELASSLLVQPAEGFALEQARARRSKEILELVLTAEASRDKYLREIERLSAALDAAEKAGKIKPVVENG